MMKTSPEITIFVRTLWQHVERRALGLEEVELRQSAVALRQLFDEIGPDRDSKDIGEALAALIMIVAVEATREKSGRICSVTVCAEAGHPYCTPLSNYQDLRLHSKAIIQAAICHLDGAYGISTSRLLEVVNRFWEKIGA